MGDPINIYSISSNQFVVEGCKYPLTLQELGGKKLKGKIIFPKYTRTLLSIRRAFSQTDIDIERALWEESVNTPWGFICRTDLRGLKGSLYDHQLQGVEYLINNPHRGALLALPPRYGKTIVSIVAARILSFKSILVVCPKTLQFNWEREIREWDRGSSVSIQTSGTEIQTTKWVICSYDYVRLHPNDLSRKWGLAILDESILVKSRQAKKFQTLKKFLRPIGKVWALSGAPITHDVTDLWGQFHLLDPYAFGSFWKFAEQYAIVNRGPWGWEIVESRQDIDFRSEFRDILFCLSPEELPQLPKMVSTTVHLPLSNSQSEVYDPLLNDWIVELETGRELVSSRMAQLTKLLGLVSDRANLDRTFASSKIEYIIENLESFQTPIVFWTHWRATAEHLCTQLEKVVRGQWGHLSSDLTPEERNDLIVEYSSGDIPYLVCSLGVGKYGLALTPTSTVIYVDQTWKSDDVVQSMFRVQKVGKSYCPDIIVLKVANTVDQLISENLEKKFGDLSRLSSTDLASLLRSIGKGEE